MSAAVLCLGMQTAHALSTTATVTFSFGGSTGGGAGTDVAWTSNAANSLGSASNSTYFSTLSGYNGLGYYNGDFTSTAQCAAGAGLVPATGTSITARKYGCRYASVGLTTLGVASVPSDSGPGGVATGTLSVTDSTLTGTLTLLSSTDEPTGATTTFSSGIRTSNSVGDGANGYNYRSADGSPFGNSWYGLTTAGVLTVNLTGIFTNSSWQIDGGSVTYADGGFACAQSGVGGSGAGTLCTSSNNAGGFDGGGGGMSFGWDLDGARTGITSAAAIQLRDGAGTTVLDTLSGVLASLSLDANGNITTNAGEYRRGLGSSFSGCGSFLKYSGTAITCGTLTAGSLSVVGTQVIPVPAALWLFGSALGILGFVRRKLSA